MEKPVLWIVEPLGVDVSVVEDQIREAVDAECLWGELSDSEKERVTVLVTVKTPVTADLLTQVPNLQAVAVAFTGYDAVDLTACRAHGITVMNVPEYATTAVAELVIGLSISLLRELPQAIEMMKHGEWGVTSGDELSGKTVGIVGTGAIGVATAARFAAFGCTVVGWSRSKRTDFTEYGTYIDTLEELLGRADIVSLHVPLTPQTTGLIDAAALTQMKSDAVLINTARGPVVDEAALLTALDTGGIRAAALDVFSSEPLPADHPLRTHERVLATPHISFNSTPALRERLAVTVRNVRDFLQGSPEHVVS